MSAAVRVTFAILMGILAVLAPTTLSAALFTTSAIAAAMSAGIHLAEMWGPR